MRSVVSRHGGSLLNFLAGIVLSSIATGSALFVFSFTVDGVVKADFVAVVASVVSVVLIGFVAEFLWRVTFALRYHTVTIYSDGIGFVDDSAERFVAWEDLNGVVEISVHEAVPVLAPPLHLLLPRWRSKRYEIWVDGDDLPYSYDKNGVADIERFRELLFESCEKHEIPVMRKTESHT